MNLAKRFVTAIVVFLGIFALTDMALAAGKGKHHAHNGKQQVGEKIKRLFGRRDQDIEWLTVGNQIYIVQSRPYVQAR